MMASSTSSGSPPGKYTTASENGITPVNVIVIGAVMPALAFMAGLLRHVSRVKLSRKLRSDDVLIIIAIVLTFGLGIMLIIGSALGGLARPTPQGTTPKAYFYTTDHAEIVTEKIFWAFNLVQCLAFGAVKASVLCFYRLIFAKDQLFNLVTIFMLTIVGIWSTGFFFAILFRCNTDFWALWAPLRDLIEHCYQSTPMFLAFSISDVVTDVIILLIPVYWVMKLRMPLSKRLAVMGVFALGFAAVAAGCVRLAIFVRQTKNPYLNADGIGHLTNEIWYSMIEMGISVVAACLPTLGPLLSYRSSLSSERLRSFFYSLRSQNSRERQSTNTTLLDDHPPPSSSRQGSLGNESEDVMVEIKDANVSGIEPNLIASRVRDMEGNDQV